MKITAALKKMKEKTVKNNDSSTKATKVPEMKPAEMKEEKTTAPSKKIYNILLLTNSDSDNVGDQVIEACDISLISAVMKNLKIPGDQYVINSRAASIVSVKYLTTKNPNLLETARTVIRQSDLVIFGGAPIFNYDHQVFYERTAVTLEIAEEYHKPVIFSAIGVEGYDEKNPKCQRVKKTLNFDCVKQMTTRDDFLSLQKYIYNKQIVLDKVSDPAVFTSKVFEPYKSPRKADANKKVGIFILRANGFKDNNIDFTKKDSAALWKGIIRELKNKGYDYELLTSGHFGDEAFLDSLIRNYGISEKQCIFNINSPEKLVQKISSYDAVISCRLHPSIISYSLDVPSLGIVWNSKVNGFYNGIGYDDRIIEVKGIDPKQVVEKVELAIAQGVNKNEQYLTSVYNTLFYGIQKILCPGNKSTKPYSYTELMKNIPSYAGTSEDEQNEKLKRKFRRIYKSMSDRAARNQKTVDELKAENKRLKELLKEKEGEQA